MSPPLSLTRPLGWAFHSVIVQGVNCAEFEPAFGLSPPLSLDSYSQQHCFADQWRCAQANGELNHLLSDEEHMLAGCCHTGHDIDCVARLCTLDLIAYLSHVLSICFCLYLAHRVMRGVCKCVQKHCQVEASTQNVWHLHFIMLGVRSKIIRGQIGACTIRHS